MQLVKSVFTLFVSVLILSTMAETKIPDRINGGYENINSRKEYHYEVYPGEQIWHEHGRAYWKSEKTVKAPAKIIEVVKTKVAAVEKSDRDSDGDGVLDSRDRCQSTPAGRTVNAFGCIQKKMKLDIKFELNKAVLKRDYLEDINKVGKVLSENPSMKIKIDGHTDTSGESSFNKSLSQARSKAVARYLKENYEISSEQLDTAGYGEEKPIADNSTRAGRKLNRRVEMELL